MSDSKYDNKHHAKGSNKILTEPFLYFLHAFSMGTNTIRSFPHKRGPISMTIHFSASTREKDDIEEGVMTAWAVINPFKPAGISGFYGPYPLI